MVDCIYNNIATTSFVHGINKPSFDKIKSLIANILALERMIDT